MIRLALHAAFAKGFGGAEVRAAVERWLAAAPPDRVVVIDPSREMAEIIMHEVRQGLGISASGATFEDLARDPALLSGALAVVLPCAAMRTARPRRLREVRMLSPSALERLREALTVVVPRGESRKRGHSRA